MPDMPATRNSRIWIAGAALVVLILVFRWIPHPPNFTPVLAVALLGGSLFPRLTPALFLAPTALLASDLVLGGYDGAWGVYLATFLCAALGRLPSVWRSAPTVLLGAGTASVLFFLISNFAVWWSGSHSYAPTAAGLAACYLAAVPFFFHTLLSTCLFSLLFLMLRKPAGLWNVRTARAGALALPILACGLLLSAPQTLQADISERPLDGLWRGSFDINGKGPFDFTSLHLNGEVSAFSIRSKVVYRGHVSGDENAYRSDLSMYILDGSMFGSVQLQGDVVQDDRAILARYRTSGGDTGALRLEYDELFRRPVTVPDITGLWEYSGNGLSISINFSEDGEVRGADSADCNYYGTVNAVRPGINAFRVSLEIASCGTTDGHYEGAMYFDDSELPDGAVHLSVASDRIGLYYPLARVESAQ